MPKVTNTRKQRAKELFARLQRGPSLFPRFDQSDSISRQDYEDSYRRWFQSWNETELLDLIPELRKAKQDTNDPRAQMENL